MEEAEYYIDSLVARQLESKIKPILTQREWYVIKRYFGIGIPGQRIVTIAAEFFVTPSRVYQIKKQAIRKLREHWRNTHSYTTPDNMGNGYGTGIITGDDLL